MHGFVCRTRMLQWKWPAQPKWAFSAHCQPLSTFCQPSTFLHIVNPAPLFRPALKLCTSFMRGVCYSFSSNQRTCSRTSCANFSLHCPRVGICLSCSVLKCQNMQTCVCVCDPHDPVDSFVQRIPFESVCTVLMPNTILPWSWPSHANSFPSPSQRASCLLPCPGKPGSRESQVPEPCCLQK